MPGLVLTVLLKPSAVGQLCSSNKKGSTMNAQNAQAPQSLDNIKPLLRELLELRAEKKEIEAEIKELDSKVRPVIANRGKMQLDNFIFECKEMAGRKTLDKKALEEFLEQHGKTVADFEKQGAPFTQLNVIEAAETL